MSFGLSGRRRVISTAGVTRRLVGGSRSTTGLSSGALGEHRVIEHRVKARRLVGGTGLLSGALQAVTRAATELFYFLAAKIYGTEKAGLPEGWLAEALLALVICASIKLLHCKE